LIARSRKAGEEGELRETIMARRPSGTHVTGESPLRPEGISGSARLNWRGPPPRFHESVWGVLHKLIYLNALSVPQRRRLFFAAKSRMGPSPGPAEGLWSSLCDLEALCAQLPVSNARWPEWLTQPRGFSAGFNEYDYAYLQYCPRCLEHGFHSVVFQSLDLARCPEHDETILDICPGCRGHIPYWRSTLAWRAFECPCGHSLWAGRDGVAAWYPPTSFGRRLDVFAQRLKQSALSGGGAWLLAVQAPRTLPNAGQTLQDNVLFGMPHRWHRLFRSKRFLALGTRSRVPLEAVYRPVSSSLAQGCKGLLQDALKYARVHLPNHGQCLAKPIGEAQKPQLPPGACVIAHAHHLWRRQWSDSQTQRQMHEILLWTVIQTLQTLQERRILRARTIAAIPQWSALWRFIGERIMLNNLLQWFVVSDHLLAHWDQPGRSPLTTSPNPVYNIRFRPTLPMMWARSASQAHQYLEVFHTGPSGISTWNRIGCAEYTSARRDPHSGDEFEIREALTRLINRPSRDWADSNDAPRLLIDSSDELDLL
jgi:hypothetical protein